MASADTAHVPPQNLEAEESALGAMMVSEGAIDAVILDVRLNEEDFYREGHRVVYRAIQALHERGDPVDSISVAEHLTQTGELAEAGGRENVTQLPSAVPAPGNARHYARIVKQNALLRRLLNASHRIQKSVHEREGEPSDLVEQAESLLFRVAYEDRASDFRKVSDVLAEEVDRLEALARGDRELTGTASGFRDLDSLLGGFQPGNLIILAARPAMGKSALVCNIADNVAGGTGETVAFFSLEMSEVELAHRFISCRARVSNDKLRKGKVTQREWPKVLKACNELEDSPALARRLVRPQPARPAREVPTAGLQRGRRQARPGDRRLHAARCAPTIRAPGGVEQVGQISRGLKVLARELEVPVIALSQLSRAPELRTGPDRGKPMLSDLRESGSLEQDADVVGFIYRQAMYDEEADPSEAELIIAKHRNGPTGSVEMVFLEQYPRFVDKAHGNMARPVDQRPGEGPPLVDVADEA